MTSTLKGVGGGRVKQKWDFIRRKGMGGIGEAGGSEYSGRLIFIFLLKKIDLRHDQTSCWVKH